MINRSPYDGQPYYCALCGAGYGEYIACEMPDCKLETEKESLRRRKKYIKQNVKP